MNGHCTSKELPQASNTSSKVNSNCEHACHAVLNDVACTMLFNNRPSVAAPLALCVRKLSQKFDVPPLQYSLMAPEKLLPPWQWQVVECDTSFTWSHKDAPEIHIRMYSLEVHAKYSHPEFYTDASKSYLDVSYAVIGPFFSEFSTLSPETSTFSAKAYALLPAVRHVRKAEVQKVVTLTDSLSVTKSLILPPKHKNNIIRQLYSILCAAHACNGHIVLCCFPGHRDVKGNVLVDEMARAITSKPNTSSLAVPATELKPTLRKAITGFWQRPWDKETSNKLHLIKPQLGNWHPTTKIRMNNVTFCRLRIVHTYCTHCTHLLKGNPGGFSTIFWYLCFQ